MGATLAAIIAMLSLKATDWFIGGPLGNFTADIVKGIVRKATALLKKKGSGTNEQLLVAIHTTKLNATSIMVSTLCQHWESLGAKTEAKDLKAGYGKWVRDKKRIILEFPEQLDDEAFSKNIDKIFASKVEPDIGEIQKKFTQIAKEEFWKELSYGLQLHQYTPHDKLRDFLINGWKIDDVFIDWFDLVVISFSQYLKGDGKASRQTEIDLVNQLLSDIKSQGKSVELTLADFDEALNTFGSKLTLVDKKLETTNNWLKEILNALDPQPFLTADFSGYNYHNLLLFKKRWVPFYGREQEMALLLNFCHAESNLSWWILKGSGGNGKSRLALELCNQLSSKWNKGFLLPEELENFNWNEWIPDVPTLIVIDYASSHYKKIIRKLKILYARRIQLKCAVKILLLERNTSEIWWSEFQRQQHENIPAIWSEPLSLPTLPEEGIWQIFKFILKGRKIDRAQTLAHFRKLDDQMRPLYASFAALSMMENENIFSWTRTDLLNAELDRLYLDSWRAKCTDEKQLRKFILFSVLVTLTGGLNEENVISILKRRLSWLPDADELSSGLDLYQLIGSVSRNEAGFVFQAFKPDLVGEYFILRELEAEKNQLFNVVKLLVQLAWEMQPRNTEDAIRRCYLDFHELAVKGHFLQIHDDDCTTDEQKISYAHLLSFHVTNRFFHYKDSEALDTFNHLRSLKNWQLADVHSIIASTIYLVIDTACKTDLLKFIDHSDLTAEGFDSKEIYFEYFEEIKDLNENRVLIWQAYSASRIISNCLSSELPFAEKFYGYLVQLAKTNIREVRIYQAMGAANLSDFYPSNDIPRQKAEMYYVIAKDIALETKHDYLFEQLSEIALMFVDFTATTPITAHHYYIDIKLFMQENDIYGVYLAKAFKSSYKWAQPDTIRDMLADISQLLKSRHQLVSDWAFVGLEEFFWWIEAYNNKLDKLFTLLIVHIRTLTPDHMLHPIYRNFERNLSRMGISLNSVLSEAGDLPWPIFNWKELKQKGEKSGENNTQ